MYIDTHCHLHFDQFATDREKIIQRAIQNKIEAVITIGTDLKTSKMAISLAEKFAIVHAAVGIHPNDSAGVDIEQLDKIESLFKKDKVVALGEIGLDYYREHAPKEHQQKIFRYQIQLAQKLQVPVIIHNRDAHEDLMNIIVEEKVHKISGVLHSFYGSESFLENALKHNLFVSFTGVVTFKNTNYFKLVDQVPLQQLLLETDSPFLAPEPFRGKRNEPSFLIYTAEKIAQIKGVSTKKLAEVSSENARNLFRINK